MGKTKTTSGHRGLPSPASSLCKRMCVIPTDPWHVRIQSVGEVCLLLRESPCDADDVSEA